jgi:hypothetical protein
MFTARSFAKNAQDFASGLPTYPSKKLRVGFTPAGRLNWCTGKDSNLRTSLGGTDLQSVGFNHSPTCAKTFGRCGRRAPSGRLRFPSAESFISTDLCAAHITHLQFRQTGKPGSRKKTTAKITARREKIRMECLGKTCRVTAPSAACRLLLPKST